MQDVKHEFYDNGKPRHPIELIPDARYVVIRTELVNETYNEKRGGRQLVVKYYVEKGR